MNFEGEDVGFEDLVNTIYSISKKMCTICGKSGRLAVIDSYETTLCDEHFIANVATNKWISEKI